MKVRRVALVAYVLAVHAALVVVLLNSDFTERVGRKFGRLNDQQAKILARQDVWAQTAPQGTTVFLGDSLTEGLPASAVAPVAINFGIGGITSAELVANLPHYEPALQRAGRVFLMIGTNDVIRGKFEGVDERVATAIRAVPAGTPLVLASIPPNFRPVDGSKLQALNAKLQQLCADRAGCRFVDSAQTFAPAGQPLRELFAADDLHFTVEGYRRWVATLRDAMSSEQRMTAPAA